jgi:hypothetical protein
LGPELSNIFLLLLSSKGVSSSKGTTFQKVIYPTFLLSIGCTRESLLNSHLLYAIQGRLGEPHIILPDPLNKVSQQYLF